MFAEAISLEGIRKTLVLELKVQEGVDIIILRMVTPRPDYRWAAAALSLSHVFQSGPLSIYFHV